MKKYILLILLCLFLYGCEDEEIFENLHAEVDIKQDVEGVGPLTLKEIDRQPVVGKNKFRDFILCNDSDDGKEQYYKKGSISYSYRIKSSATGEYELNANEEPKVDGYKISDKCDSGKLIEMYCKGNKAAWQRVSC